MNVKCWCKCKMLNAFRHTVATIKTDKYYKQGLQRFYMEPYGVYLYSCFNRKKQTNKQYNA